MRSPLLGLSFLSVILFSCALSAEQGETAGPAATVNPSPVDIELTDTDTDAVVTPTPLAKATAVVTTEPSSVPRGVFPTIDALCREQRAAILPRLREAQVSLSEQGETSPLQASCHEAPKPLRDTKIALAAPFLEVRAIEIEAGYATETHLVVRTAEGWRAVQQASLDEAHNDPGCPSITRNIGIREVRVQGTEPSLVVIVQAARGAGEEVIETEAEGVAHYRVFSIVLDRASACRIGGDDVRCDDPVVVGAVRTTSGDTIPTSEEPVFTTTYGLDAAGHVRAAAKYVDALYGE